MLRSEESLDVFEEHMRLANPFDDNRVTQVDQLATNIPQINQSEFDSLRLHAVKAVHGEHGRGVLVTGPPGIGKSHLLARFGHWARSEKYPFVYLLNLQAGPSDILRTILRTCISTLSRDFSTAPWRTRLFKLVSIVAARAIARYSPDRAPTMKQCERMYRRFLEERNHQGTVYDIFWQLFEDIQLQRSGHPSTGKAALVRRWLSGNYLDPDEAERLHLSPASNSEDGSVLSLEEMKEVIRILSEFAVCRDRCFILCFDQVDTLSEEQVQAWSATVHALLDLCPGLLVVTSGVDETFLRWTSHDLVSKASWDDRIRQFPLVLGGIDAESARMLILQRLQHSWEPFDDQPLIHKLRIHDEYFPLGRVQVDSILHDSHGMPLNDLRPRDVIGRAGGLWERQVGVIEREGIESWLAAWGEEGSVDDKAARTRVSGQGSDRENYEAAETAEALTDQTINEKLAEHFQMRQLRPEQLPPDSGNLSGLLFNILTMCLNAPEPYRSTLYGQLRDVERHLHTGGPVPPFQLTVLQQQPVTGIPRRVGVVVANSSQGVAATNMLKRIHFELTENHSIDQVILVIDARLPLKPGAAGQAVLEQLLAHPGPFHLEYLAFDQYSRLEALESIAGLARAGDLTRRTQRDAQVSLSEVDVWESHHRCKRLYSIALLRCLVEISPGEKELRPPSSPNLE